MAAKLHFLAGRKIRQRRRELGLSQEALADMCGLHRTYIGGVERGERNITLDSLEQIASALQISPAALISGNEGDVSQE